MTLISAARRQIPALGLVCMTESDQCRFRTITRTRYLSLTAREKRRTLAELYQDNLTRLHAALDFCLAREIRLYRAPSGLFPMSDERIGESILRSMAPALAAVGRRARRRVRIVLHPDQFVVLNSDWPDVIDTSIRILEKHALAFDLMGLPRSTFAAMNIHGGRSGQADRLVDVILTRLSPGVRRRLTLENDEYSFSAADILSICRRARVPMVFDCHHHLIKQKLDSYDHPSIARFTRLARDTWPKPHWQMVHVSNGRASLHDRSHADLVTQMPRAFARVPWIEVEAKGKESAIDLLRGATSASV